MPCAASPTGRATRVGSSWSRNSRRNHVSGSTTPTRSHPRGTDRLERPVVGPLRRRRRRVRHPRVPRPRCRPIPLAVGVRRDRRPAAPPARAAQPGGHGGRDPSAARAPSPCTQAGCSRRGSDARRHHHHRSFHSSTPTTTSRSSSCRCDSNAFRRDRDRRPGAPHPRVSRRRLRRHARTRAHRGGGRGRARRLGTRRGRNSRRCGTEKRRANSPPSTCPSGRRGSRSPHGRRTSDRVMPRHSSPTSPARDLPWPRAAHTTMLPDRWVAWGRLLGDTIGPVVGNPIAEQVVLGPNPDPNAVPSDLLDVLDADRGLDRRLRRRRSTGHGAPAPAHRQLVAGAQHGLRRRRQAPSTDADGAARIADLLERPPLHRRPRARPAGNTDEQHHRRPRRASSVAPTPRTSAHCARRPVVHAGGHQRHRWRRRDRHRRPRLAQALGLEPDAFAAPSTVGSPARATRLPWPPFSGRRRGATTSNR